MSDRQSGILKAASFQSNSPDPNIKQMEVCEVCGALLIVGDMQQRLDEHLTGKQHMGYAQVRATVLDMQVCVVNELFLML